MAKTPEGLIKMAVRKILDPYKPALYYNMPVPTGYGKSMLDFVGCYKGLFFMVETKTPDKDLTPLQALCKEEVEAAGGRVFRVRGGDGLRELEAWLKSL